MRGGERHGGTVAPPFAVADVANAAYCGRKAYLARDEERGEPPADVAAVRELAYHYETLLDRPTAAVRHVCDRVDAEPGTVAGEMELELILERLSGLRGDPLWDAVARPVREETVLRSERFVGRLDKLVRLPSTSGGPSNGANAAVLAPVRVAGGRPPTDGVWHSQRVRCAALHALLAAHRDGVGDRAVVEYPRVGAVRAFRLQERDRRALADAVDALDGATRGHPPSRTSNPAKCNACRFRERCGVPTRSLRTRLAERLPWAGSDDG